MRISERGAALLLTAKGAYAEHDVYGSDDKDVYGKRVFKVVGAEVDSRDEVVGSGAVICGPTAGKRIALALVAALSSSWPYTSDSLDASLVGSIVSARMFRRLPMAILDQVFHVVSPKELDPEHPVLRPLSRAATQELAIFAALAPVCCSNLAVPMHPKIYATNASNTKGGIVSAEVPRRFRKFSRGQPIRKAAMCPSLVLRRSSLTPMVLTLSSCLRHFLVRRRNAR